MSPTRSQPAPAPRNFGSDAITPFGGAGPGGSQRRANESSKESRSTAPEAGGLRVVVRPEYLPEHSDTDALRFVFGYHIHIENRGAEPATLISRHWIIVDGDGDRHEVEGEGVVGHQPRLLPGESFEYASYCPLETRWGTMEGVYHMRLDDGSMFEARIARFFLVAPEFERDDD